MQLHASRLFLFYLQAVAIVLVSSLQYATFLSLLFPPLPQYCGLQSFGWTYKKGISSTILMYWLTGKPNIWARLKKIVVLLWDMDRRFFDEMKISLSFNPDWWLILTWAPEIGVHGSVQWVTLLFILQSWYFMQPPHAVAFLALVFYFPSPGTAQLTVKLFPVVVVTRTLITVPFWAGLDGIAVQMSGSATNCPESNMTVGYL